MLSFFAFLLVHVTLVVMTGFTRNMNHIVMGTDDQNRIGMWLGFVGIGVVVLSWVVAHYLSWHHPRGLQHALKSVTYPMQLLTLNRLIPQQHYSEQEISPYFWPNGKMPCERGLEASGRERLPGFQIKGGRTGRKSCRAFTCRHRELGKVEHITMHHCIQGWSGIAKWGGIPMKTLIELVRPKPEAKVVAFFSFGEALYGGAYYDTQRMENCIEGGMPARIADERATASGGIWRSAAAAR